MSQVRCQPVTLTPEQVQNTWDAWQNPGSNGFHMFVICLGKRVIGEIGYRRDKDDPQTFIPDIKIGEPSLWGQGLGAEAIQLFLDYLFNELHALHIRADIGDWNQRSLRMALKCGFIELGREETPATEFYSGGIAVHMQFDKPLLS